MPDWAIVALIGAVVLFGANKLPEIARNLGRSSGEFKKGLKEGHDETTSAAGAPPASGVGPPPSAPPPGLVPDRDEQRPETSP